MYVFSITNFATATGKYERCRGGRLYHFKLANSKSMPDFFYVHLQYLPYVYQKPDTLFCYYIY